MKDIPAGLLNYLKAAGGAEIATCWKLTLTNGDIMGFTDHDSDIVFSGVTYTARTGYDRTAVASNNTLAVDNMDLEGAIAAEGLSKEGLRSGLYDYASVEIFLVNPRNTDAGRVILRRGVLGEITTREGIFVTEIRGMSQFLNRQLLRIVTPECDARVYDTRCGVNPTAYTNTGTVASIVTAKREITVSISGTIRASGYFSNGLITFTSGLANNRSIEIKTHEIISSVDHLIFLLPMQYEIRVGDAFSIRRGCDQLFETCKTVFDNVENFRGFPHVPGFDKMTWYPDSNA